MTMPNFLIIGTPKSGTTSIYNYLKQHPEIYTSSVKEPAFFAFEGMKLDRTVGPFAEGLKNRPPDSLKWYQERLSVAITNLEDYQRLFKEVASEKAIGEASPGYMYFSQSAERLHHFTFHQA